MHTAIIQLSGLLQGCDVITLNHHPQPRIQHSCSCKNSGTANGETWWVVLAQTCLNWPIGENQAFKDEGLKEKGIKMGRWDKEWMEAPLKRTVPEKYCFKLCKKNCRRPKHKCEPEDEHQMGPLKGDRSWQVHQRQPLLSTVPEGSWCGRRENSGTSGEYGCFPWALGKPWDLQYHPPSGTCSPPAESEFWLVLWSNPTRLC